MSFRERPAFLKKLSRLDTKRWNCKKCYQCRCNVRMWYRPFFSKVRNFEFKVRNQSSKSKFRFEKSKFKFEKSKFRFPRTLIFLNISKIKVQFWKIKVQIWKNQSSSKSGVWFFKVKIKVRTLILEKGLDGAQSWRFTRLLNTPPVTYGSGDPEAV